MVCDACFNRVKVKSPQYVLVSLLSWRDREGLNKRRMLEIVRTNEGTAIQDYFPHALLGDEFLSYFPQWKELYMHLKTRYDELCESGRVVFIVL